MKSFDIVLTAATYKRNETIQVKTESKIYLTDDTAFLDDASFLDEVKALWKKARKAVKDGSFESIEICESSYDNWSDPDKYLVQKSFDRWIGYMRDQSADDEGIYLRPDERYTALGRDMYLSKDVIKDMAYTLC